MEKRKPQPGSIISGTCRPQDLIPAFVDEIKYLGGSIPDDLAYDGQYDDDPYWESMACAHDKQALFDALNELCHDYMYFGAHPDDGACYGFWIDMESINEDIYGRYVIKVSDTSEIPDSYNGLVAHVNDHGNLSLYSKNGEELAELWAIV